MRNKYNYNELVRVNGEGKQFGKVEGQLGFIIEKDLFYNDYYIDLIFGEKDWFNESSIERILGERRNKTEKYQVGLCTTKEGIELIELRLKEKEPISNNKFKRISIYKEFERKGKKYIIPVWKSAFWPVSNKSIRILEKTIEEFRSKRIPFQYVLLNEDVLTGIKVMEFCETDKNVKVFSIDRNIKIKNIKETTDFSRERIKNDSTKNIKCNDKHRSNNKG